jgi:plastocyanin
VEKYINGFDQKKRVKADANKEASGTFGPIGKYTRNCTKHIHHVVGFCI